MLSNVLAALALSSLVSAAPTGSSGSSSSSWPSTTTTWYSLPQLARFENDANGVPLVAVAPINLYLDIFWQGMSLTMTTAASALSGIVVNSPLNCAAYGAGDTATITQGTPSMTVNYADSTIDHFDLKSFYFACAVGAEASAAGAPLACKVTVTGKAKDGSVKAKQSFSFAPTGLSANQVQAVLSKDFVSLYTAEFSTDTGATTTASATLIDTVSYTVYSDKSLV